MMANGSIQKSNIARLFIITFLAGITAAILFIYQGNSPATSSPSEPTQENTAKIAATSDDIDREIDTLLFHFGIENDWVRKQEIPLPNSPLHRTERKVFIPRDITPVFINQAMNTMAKKYHGRAIGSENLKEGTLTIHLEIERLIIHTVILKTNSEIHRTIQNTPTSRG